MKNIIGKYKNGNYYVMLLDDGSKMRMAPEDVFTPAFAENCDVKITDKCDGGCEFCYEGCSNCGKHGDILNPLFLNTLHPYTELAINGNDLSHPDLIPFLEKLKEKKVVANMTVNQKHLIKHFDYIKKLSNDGLIKGIGVSLVNANEEFIKMVNSLNNVVIHVINGIFTENDFNVLSDKNLKLLILGYKQLNRGVKFYDNNIDIITKNQNWLSSNIKEISEHFNVVSFDNLAINQLNIKRLFTEEEWERFYMGDDGMVTFYIDLVEKTFSKNSISQKRFALLDSIDDMFDVITKAGDCNE